MPKLPRPSGLPTRIPAWAWKRLRFPGRKPQAGPHRLPAWFWVWRAWRLNLHIPRKRTRRQKAVTYAQASLRFAGRMVYDEGPLRSELFNRKPGDFLGAHADCSQFVSAIMHWSGVKKVNQWDDTGTLLEKGRSASTPAVARLIIAGPETGVHTGMFVGKTDGEWQIVEFGDQAAPDQISEANFVAYFRGRGINEFRYRDFF